MLGYCLRAPEFFLLMTTLGVSPSPLNLSLAKIQKPNELITALSIKTIKKKKKSLAAFAGSCHTWGPQSSQLGEYDTSDAGDLHPQERTLKINLSSTHFHIHRFDYFFWCILILEEIIISPRPNSQYWAARILESFPLLRHTTCGTLKIHCTLSEQGKDLKHGKHEKSHERCIEACSFPSTYL